MYNTFNMFFVRVMGVIIEQYNMRNYNKHEILLLDTCLLYLYFPPDWVGQYLGIYHNNITHISSSIYHDFYIYRYTLFPCPFLQQYCKYGTHEVVHNYYRFQKYDLIFNQTFYFTYCEFYL